MNKYYCSAYMEFDTDKTSREDAWEELVYVCNKVGVRIEWNEAVEDAICDENGNEIEEEKE